MSLRNVRNKRAFPSSANDMSGMNLLEYYAGQAMVGLLAEPTSRNIVLTNSPGADDILEQYAKAAWRIAEWMVSEHPDAI